MPSAVRIRAAARLNARIFEVHVHRGAFTIVRTGPPIRVRMLRTPVRQCRRVVCRWTCGTRPAGRPLRTPDGRLMMVMQRRPLGSGPEHRWSGIGRRCATKSPRWRAQFIARRPDAHGRHVASARQQRSVRAILDEHLLAFWLVRHGDRRQRTPVPRVNALGLWSYDLKQRIVARGGSVQGFDDATIPASIRAIYKTAWELPMRVIVEHAIGRGPYICQSQSMNLFKADPTPEWLTRSLLYAWKGGLKGGMYYLRTRPAVDPIAFTLAKADILEAATAATATSAAALLSASSATISPHKTDASSSDESAAAMPLSSSTGSGLDTAACPRRPARGPNGEYVPCEVCSS